MPKPFANLTGNGCHMHEVLSPCHSIFWMQSVPWEKRGASPGLGGETVKAFAKLKYGEWNEFKRHLSSWEREYTLDR